MVPLAKSVRHVRDYDLEVTFTNGVKRVVPLWDQVVSKGGEMVKPLRDVAYFKRVRISADFGVLEWPNGYDICPDVLYWLATGQLIKWATDPMFHRPPPHLATRTTRNRTAQKKSRRPAKLR